MARRPDRLEGAVPLTFVALDVLWLDEAPTLALPYSERRALLDSLALQGEGWATVYAIDGYSADLGARSAPSSAWRGWWPSG